MGSEGLPCTRFPNPLGRLVPTGREKFAKIMKAALPALAFVLLLTVSALVGGVDAMICNLLINIASALVTGSRVEGSPSP